jgi:glyoxylate/hydroxypyruvate reductase
LVIIAKTIPNSKNIVFRPLIFWLSLLEKKYLGMNLVIISRKSNQKEWVKALKDLDPDLKVGIYPHDENRDEVDFALAWQPEKGVFKHYPKLKWIASTGAGVDHILRDPDLLTDIVVTRVVDSKLTEDMTAYLVAQVMCQIRDVSSYKFLQAGKEWQPKKYPDKSKTTIGIMGFGELGKDAAIKFSQLGFKVRGWANSPKSIDGIEVFVGQVEMNDFLSETDFLICLLPLTSATVNILNRETFGQLPKGAFVINVARGEHLVEDDLLACLDDDHLAGACLDVFREEPLPRNHRFWSHPKVTITPHIASITSPASVAPQIVENIKRLSEGVELKNVVSRSKGY